MVKRIFQVTLTLLFLNSQAAYSQECLANAGLDISICDGDGTSSNYTGLDGENSTLSEGDINYDWTVITVVGNGEWEESLVITNSESDESDPRFKYPKNLNVNTDFLIELRIFNDENTCESFDTVSVSIKSNMCPRADAGSDQILSNGCNLILSLDGSDSEDPQGDEVSYQWSSLGGLDNNFIVSNTASATFEFPSTDSDQTYLFILTVTDSEQSDTDTVKVIYFDNDAPFANAGSDIVSCEYQFYLSARQSYDINYNTLEYTWSSLDGLDISGTSSIKPLVTSPLDLTEDVSYRIALKVFDGYCSSHDTLLVTIKDNLCPVANAGEDARIPKYQSSRVTLNAENSIDSDGQIESYEWSDLSGIISMNPLLEVFDLDSNSSFSSYTYILKVKDNENSISEDTVKVIFSDLSAPESPTVYAVASHGQVLVSWDASSESSNDSLTGYSDFEGYKLYRSLDGGATWGGDDDKLYDFNGEFIGWTPYAQFDYTFENDFYHCIYNNDECEDEDIRGASISGLDPYLPRFSLGSNSGLEYSYVDSNVIDGVEYTYTVTAYDYGLPKFELLFSEPDSSGFLTADTSWSSLNPANFIGPDSIQYFNNYGFAIRKEANPERGFPFLESEKGDSSSHNFIKVIPGYTALNISFPDANDIEALFTSNISNIGTGDRDYFIVDRNNIVKDMVKYEVQASQSSTAVDGMACEDPLIYGYVVTDSSGTPSTFTTFYENDLSFFEKDSIAGLPGTLYENNSYLVPNYDVISSVGKWSDQFKGIRYKMENKIPLNISAVPSVSLDTLLWSWADPDSSLMDSATTYNLLYLMKPSLSYTNVASYLRRLNFDYNIEFFSEPIGDTISITNASGSGKMYFPFRITNMWTGKKVGLNCNDYGLLDASPIDFSNGAGNYVWTPGEDISLIRDSLKIAGAWVEAFNYKLELRVPISNSQKSNKAYNQTKSYEIGEQVYYQGSMWYALLPADAGVDPISVHLDLEDDGIRNSPWRPIYPWAHITSLNWNGEEFKIGPGNKNLLIKPHKLFVDGDSWLSDMSKLGEEVGISDTLCLDSIKVVPNPYKASSAFNEGPNVRKIRFTHLPTSCQISIYTISGEHVTTFKHEKQFDGNSWWNLRTGNSQDGPEISPGLYIYTIEFENEQEYCIDTYDNDGDVQGSLKNDYYSNQTYDVDSNGRSARVKKKTKFHIGKFAVIR